MQAGGTSDASKAYNAAVDYAPSTDAAFAALSGCVRAQEAEEAWEALLVTVDRFQALDLLWKQDVQANLELTRLNAERFLGTDESKIITRCRALTTDDALSSNVRLSAALLGMAASDDLPDSDGIRWFYDLANAVADPDGGSALTLFKCHIIFHTSIGDLDLAEHYAQQVVALTRASKDDAAAIVALKFAHYPPRRSGNSILALERLNRAAQIALRLKRSHAHVVLMDLIAGVLLDYGRPLEAIAFTRAVTDHDKVFGGPFRRQSALDTRALAHCLLGEFDEALRLVSTPDVILAHGRRRTEMMRLAATLLVAVHAQDSNIIRECVEGIDPVRDRLFRHAGTDIVALAYATGLRKLRGSDSAKAFACWYIKEARRDRIPVLDQLSSVLS
jgi:hypothetical protein